MAVRTDEGMAGAYFTGGTWQEIKRYLNKDPMKAALIPYLPDIISNGKYSRNQLHKERTDGVSTFHEYRKTVQTSQGTFEPLENPNLRFRVFTECVRSLKAHPQPTRPGIPGH